MANPKHIDLIRRGVEHVNAWQKRNEGVCLDLSCADLSNLELQNVNLNYTNLNKANLSGSSFENSQICHTDFTEARLDGTSFSSAYLYCVDMPKTVGRRTNFRGATLNTIGAQNVELVDADFSLARLNEVGLQDSKLTGVDFCGAVLDLVGFNNSNLEKAVFSKTLLVEVEFNYSRLTKAVFADTTIGWADFEGAELSAVVHYAPSNISQSMLRKHQNLLPDVFLRGCGFAEWEILASRLYDDGLTANIVSDLLSQLFTCRAKTLFKKRVFISYSTNDQPFVEHLNSHLVYDGFITYFDCKSFIAGSLQKQIDFAVKSNDVVIVVLSKDAIRSDHVENEIELARELEKAEGRDIICPISVDDDWQRTLQTDFASRHLWRRIAQFNVLDFSKWTNPEEFESTYKKLTRGLVSNYKSRMNT